MKRKLFAERGQALVLIALAAIGLFGVAGLAIDGSAKYSDRRHAQNAADASALAGALSKVHHQPGDPAWDVVALNRALENGYDRDLVTNDVEVYNPPHTGIYANCADLHFDCHDYVQVIIDSTVNTWFARVIGIDQTHNHVEAVASAITGLGTDFNFGGNAIVSLSPTGCSLRAGGNTDVLINGGGLFSNSDSNCAFQKTTCSGTIDVNDANGNEGTVGMVGGYTINTNCWDPTATNLAAGAAKQISFPPPYQDPPAPAECATDGISTNDNSAGTTTLTPGHFTSIPLGGHKKTLYITPGVYCVDSSFTTSGIYTVTVLPPASYGDANGVFIYLKPGGSFTINSSTAISLWAPTSGTYKNFLIFAAPNYSLTTLPNCTINGNSTDQLRGTIYAPYCNMKLNGSSGTVLEAQLIGYTVDLTGASGVTLTYDDTNNGTWNYPDQVGLTK